VLRDDGSDVGESRGPETLPTPEGKVTGGRRQRKRRIDDPSFFLRRRRGGGAFAFFFGSNAQLPFSYWLLTMGCCPRAHSIVLHVYPVPFYFSPSQHVPPSFCCCCCCCSLFICLFFSAERNRAKHKQTFLFCNLLSQFDPGNSTACEGNNGPGVDGVVGLPCLSARQKVSCRTWAWRYDAAAVKNRDSHYHTTRGGGGRINPALDQRRHEIKVKKGDVPGSLTYSLALCRFLTCSPGACVSSLHMYIRTYSKVQS
jgi:hypothetical protein